MNKMDKLMLYKNFVCLLSREDETSVRRKVYV